MSKPTLTNLTATEPFGKTQLEITVGEDKFTVPLEVPYPGHYESYHKDNYTVFDLEFYFAGSACKGRHTVTVQVSKKTVVVSITYSPYTSRYIKDAKYGFKRTLT